MARSRRGWLAIALILSLVLGIVSAFTPRATAEEGTILFMEDFSAVGSRWDGATWSVETDAAASSAVGKLSSVSGAYPTARAKPAAWSDYAATNDNYKLEYKAKYADAASGAPKFYRVFFRYEASTTSVNHYYFEFRQSGNAVYFGKYVNGADTRVGSGFTVADKIPGFNFNAWHQYAVIADGSVFQLSINGVKIGQTDPDTTHARGTVGFGLKNADLFVDDVRVTPYHVEPPYPIAHTPITSAYYNTDISGTFSVEPPSSGNSVTASVYYHFGSEAYQSIPLPPSQDGQFSFVIPGTNQASTIGYYLDVQDSAGRSGRFPDTGEQTINVKPFNRFFENFENTPVGQLPADWSLRGYQPNVAVYDDGGNKVMRFANTGNGQNWAAKFVNPLYRNIDNFKISFRAKYKVTNPDPNTLYNLWRLIYRSQDTTYNTMEWGAHNTKYIMFKRTPLGGVDNGSYYRSAPDEWHQYDVEVAGITHKLYIDGQKVIEFDDASEDAPAKGFLQFGTVNGLELLIDDFEITPIAVPYVYNVEPAGSYVGVYESGEPLGLDVSVQSGPAEHAYRIAYTVSRADGDRAVVSSGDGELSVPAFESRKQTIAFVPNVTDYGVYDVKAELYMDGVKQDDKTRTMRVAVIKQAAPVKETDLEMQSKYGFNVNYDQATNPDLINSVREMGVRHARLSVPWGDIDKGGGMYDYAKTDQIVDGLVSRGINPIPILRINANGAYESGNVVTSRTGLEALRRFIPDLIRHYQGKVRYWEMPNEPELELRPYIPQEVVQFQKTAYAAMKKADLDVVLMAGAHTSGVVQILPGELELGSYDYSDAYSYHRYTYGVMPDGFIQKQYNGVRQLIDSYGGWKDLYVTESGWPTATNGYPSVSQEVQRDYAVRGFLIDMISDQLKALEHFIWRDSGFDSNFYNTNFGVTDGNGRPKLAYPALATLMTTLDKARYVGTLATGDDTVEAHVFLNGEEPVLVLWKKVNYGNTAPENAPKSAIQLAVGASEVNTIGINGQESVVPASGGQVTLQVSGSPMYVEGFGASLLFDAAAQLQAQKQAVAAAKIEALRSGGNDAAVDGLLTELTRIHGIVNAAMSGADPAERAAGIEQGAEDLYALMSSLAGRIREGTAARIAGDVALEALYNDAEYVATALIQAKRLESTPTAVRDYTAELSAARGAYEAKIGANGLMPVATAAMMRANRYGQIADRAAAEGDNADVYGFNLIAREFAKVVRDMVAAEPVIPIDVTMSATPVNQDIESGGTLPVTLSLTNRSSQQQTATLKLVVPAGWEAAQTEQPTRTVPLEPGAELDLPLNLQAPADANPGIFYAQLNLEIGGVPSDLIKIRMNLTNAVQARLMPVDKPIDELETVTVRLTGTSQTAKSGKVLLKGPDGQPLAPVITGNDAYSIAYGQTVDIPFRWTYHRTHPYNEYRGSLEVTDEATGQTIFRDTAVPLDFLIVQKAKPSLAIDGDFGDWIDAFPIHMRGPERNADGVYDPNNLDAVMYTKWDEGSFYFAVDVTDDIHKAAEPPNGLWKNDSLQIAIDPLNDKGGTYRNDDIDFGLALNNFGEQLGFVFYAQQPNSTGDISNAIPYKIVRDEANHKTYYEVQIPGDSIVKALADRLHPGGDIGFNVIVPDSDLQDGRQNYTGWTKGIAESKNPSLYDTFTFVDVPFELPDETPPVIGMPQLSAVPQIKPLQASIAVTDDHSGVAETTVMLDGKPQSNPVSLPALSLHVGPHVLQAKAKDAAGNESEQSVTFEVTLSLDQLDDVIAIGASKGWIQGKAVIASLLAKAKAIQKNGGKQKALYDIMRKEIAIWAGKKIDASFAALLQEDLDYLQKKYR